MELRFPIPPSNLVTTAPSATGGAVYSGCSITNTTSASQVLPSSQTSTSAGNLISTRKCHNLPALKGGDYLAPHQTPEEFVESVNTGKSFRDDAAKLVDQIHTIKTELGMPCMQYTAETISKEVDKFLELNAKHTCLSQEDVDALKSYQQQVKQLHQKGYPYFESLKLSLLYPLIQGMFYLAYGEVCCDEVLKESIEKSRLNIAKCRRDEIEEGLTLASAINKPWERLFEDLRTEEHQKMSWLLSRSNLPVDLGGDYISMLQKKYGFVFVPLFTEFTLEMLIRMSPTRVIPIGITTSISEEHDGFDMSSLELAFHDIWHAYKQWQIGYFDERVENRSSLPFPDISEAVIDLYFQIKNENPEMINEYCDFILFSLAHENGAAGIDSGLLTDDRMFSILLNAYNFTKIRFDGGVYKTSLEASSSCSTNDSLAKAFFVMHAFLDLAENTTGEEKECLVSKMKKHIVFNNFKLCAFKGHSYQSLVDFIRMAPIFSRKFINDVSRCKAFNQEPLKVLSPCYDKDWKKWMLQVS